MTDFEFERRFYCAQPPAELADESPTLIVQSYYVHQDNYALRVRVQVHDVDVDMTRATDARSVLRSLTDKVSEAFVTVKGPAVGGTRWIPGVYTRLYASIRGGCGRRPARNADPDRQAL